ncbi:MAG TPA: serine hydrolase domain-containing protein, partial [Hyphomonadaceae bacterium]|nr:serine hydrolase domain-containing protein [Hyphomonadaceae bacterium]
MKAATLARLPLIAAFALLAATPALAQKPIGKDPVPSILTWTPKQQLERYPAIEKTYAVGTIKKGGTVKDLPKAAKQVDPKVTFGGKTSSIDAFMKDNRITGLIAIKNGQVILEKYALGRKPEDRWTSFSVAKSVTSTLIGAAVKDGYIHSIYDPITLYLPELEGSAYDGVSLRQVMTMTSGAKWDETYTNPKSDVSQAGTADAKPGQFDTLVDYMAKLKREAPPGTKWVYKTGETDLAGLALYRALAGKSLSQYASEKLWAPYGMEQDAIWMLDKSGKERGGCCMSMTLRDYGRIGLFMLGGGKIGDKEILPPGWVDEATSNQLPKSAKDKDG